MLFFGGEGRGGRGARRRKGDWVIMMVVVSWGALYDNHGNMKASSSSSSSSLRVVHPCGFPQFAKMCLLIPGVDLTVFIGEQITHLKRRGGGSEEEEG